MSSFDDKVKKMDMNTILKFARTGYMFMEYRKENKVDELLNINMITEVKQ